MAQIISWTYLSRFKQKAIKADQIEKIKINTSKSVRNLILRFVYNSEWILYSFSLHSPIIGRPGFHRFIFLWQPDNLLPIEFRHHKVRDTLIDSINYWIGF